MQDPSGKPTSLKRAQRGRILLSAGWVLVLLAALPEHSHPSVLKSAVAQIAKDLNHSSATRPVEPVELLREALANFKARGSRAKDYVYVLHYKNKLVDVGVSNKFEVMFVDGQPYRRQVGPNGLPLSPEEEKEEKARIEALYRKWLDKDAQISRSGGDGAPTKPTEMTPTKSASDPELAEKEEIYERFKKELALDAEEMRNGGSLIVLVGDARGDIRQLRLPLQRIPDGFELQFRGHEIFEGRNTYIVEAKPRREQKSPTRDEGDASNFKMKIWVDESETEIVKVEGKAIHPGLISRSANVATDSVNPPPASDVKLRKSLPESTLKYGAGTLVSIEWRKINDVAWLPATVRFAGTEIYSGPVRLGKDVEFFSNTLPIEYEIEFSDYKNFHVETRILPPH